MADTTRKAKSAPEPLGHANVRAGSVLGNRKRVSGQRARRSPGRRLAKPTGRDVHACGFTDREKQARNFLGIPIERHEGGPATRMSLAHDPDNILHRFI